ncbi:MAG: hypothetical protein GY939_26820 [Actinomycetia bacterium]|nr:hypothetical protein [Actinomycetes bacterium]
MASLGGELTVVDPMTLEAAATIVDLGERGPSAGEEFVWLSDSNANEVAAIDAAELAVVERFSVGTNPRTPLESRGVVWVPSFDDETLSIIEPG